MTSTDRRSSPSQRAQGPHSSPALPLAELQLLVRVQGSVPLLVVERAKLLRAVGEAVEKVHAGAYVVLGQPEPTVVRAASALFTSVEQTGGDNPPSDSPTESSDSSRSAG